MRVHTPGVGAAQRGVAQLQMCASLTIARKEAYFTSKLYQLFFFAWGQSKDLLPPTQRV